MSKKEHILNVAEALFNELGYTAVGVDLIRDRAEVSKTSMYRHFGSKNKLIEAVLIRRHQRFENELLSAISTADNAENRLDAILDWHFTWFRSSNFKGCMFMHALAEFKGHDNELAQMAEQHKAWIKSLLLSVLESENDKKTDIKSEIIMTFLEGMIVRAEFADIAKYEEVYRIGIKILAFTDISIKKTP